jgi:dipeptidase
LLEPADFMKILRDVYEDTPYDLRKVPAAGRYGNPFHDDPESYSLCRHATVASFVADYSLTDSGIMWTAMACPAMSMYVPLYTDINGLPEYCSEPKPRWDKSSLFWEWRKLGLVLQRRYSLHIASTQSMIRMYEDKAVSELKKEAEELAGLSEEERRVRRTEMTGTRLWLSLSLCRELCCVLLLRY